MSLISEFKEFLNEYKVMGLAVAFIIGAALTSLVQSTVNDILMPLITPFQPSGDWKNATLSINPHVGGMINLKWGDFLANLINFIIIALVVFLIAKYALGEKKVEKK
jgi:large conductance mechanosensitive channel